MLPERHAAALGGHAFGGVAALTSNSLQIANARRWRLCDHADLVRSTVLRGNCGADAVEVRACPRQRRVWPPDEAS